MSEPSHPSVTAEGASVSEAVHNAAQALGVPAPMVEYKYDLSHFRSQSGRPVGVSTVRIIAWTRNAETVSAVIDGKAWMEELLRHMKMRGEVQAAMGRGGDRTVDIRLNSPDARFLVGRQGSTLRAIQLVLERAMARTLPGWQFRLDVEGGRERRDDDRPEGGRRDDHRGREDRGRDGRPRREGRDSRFGGRSDRSRSDDRRSMDRRSEQDVEKLRRLAVRLARQVQETGEPTELRRELNSFERRVVHMAVSEVDGVATESIGDGALKQVRIVPAVQRGDVDVSTEDLSDDPTVRNQGATGSEEG